MTVDNFAQGREVFVERTDQRLGFELFRCGGKTFDVGEQNAGLLDLAVAGLNFLVRRGDAVGDLGRDETRQIMRRGAVDDGPVEQSLGTH